MSMREDFERWAIKKATESKYPYMSHLLDRTDDDYATTWVDAAWMGWRASRESLVIELPQQSGANLNWNQAIRYCHEAIEAAGLKVKP